MTYHLSILCLLFLVLGTSWLVLFLFVSYSQGWYGQLVCAFTVAVWACLVPGQWMECFLLQANFQADGSKQWDANREDLLCAWSRSELSLWLIFFLLSLISADLEFLCLCLVSKSLVGNVLTWVIHIITKSSSGFELGLKGQVYWVGRSRTQFSRLFWMQCFNKSPF